MEDRNEDPAVGAPEGTSVEARPWEALEALAVAGDAVALDAYIDALPAGEAGRALAHLDAEDRRRVFETLLPADAAHLIEELAEAQAADLVESLDPALAARIVHELRSDDQADLLSEMEEDEAERLLAALDPVEAEAIRAQAAWPEESAGGLMARECLRYPTSMTVGEVVDDLRRNAERYRDYDVQYAYVHGKGKHLVGVLRLRDLLLAPAGGAIGRIMIPDPVTVSAATPLEALADLFAQKAYLALPVVDDTGRLLGAVRRGAVIEAMGERAEVDRLKAQGIVGEELRSMPLRRRASRRLGWLSVNILLNVIAASVIAAFEETLRAVIALAVFLPIISDMSGCSGNQAVAVSIRELSLGLVKPHEVLWVWGKEVGVGLVNGLVLGLLIGGVAMLWKGNPWLGLVVGAALAANTLVAVSVGGLIPLVLKRANLDPALASGPVLTTVTDICGFLFALGFATLMLDRLI